MGIYDEQPFLISAVGWIYFLAWSFPFYSQLYDNWKKKSVEGMSMDFIALNLSSYLLYCLYNTYGYFISEEQTGRIDSNDVAFAYHGLLATAIFVVQACVYEHGSHLVSFLTIMLSLTVWISLFIYCFLYFATHIISAPLSVSGLSFMGYYIMAISILRYIFEMYWHSKRKSIERWEVANIIFNIVGGLLSFVQAKLDLSFGGDAETNPTKIVLGILVAAFNIVLFIHYSYFMTNKKYYQQLTGKQ